MLNFVDSSTSMGYSTTSTGRHQHHLLSDCYGSWLRVGCQGLFKTTCILTWLTDIIQYDKGVGHFLRGLTQNLGVMVLPRVL